MVRIIASAAIAALLSTTVPVCALPAQTFATAIVTAAVPRGAAGRDAGVDVSGGTYVRLSASGSLATRGGLCGPNITPNGCDGSGSVNAAGTLLAAFADGYGRVLGGWVAAGAYANLAVPAGAQRLLLRINGLTGYERGAYRVVADVVTTPAPAALGSGAAGAGSAVRIGPPSAGMTQSVARSVQIGSTARRPQGTVGNGAGAGVIPTAAAVSRSDVHYALRRLGFSDTPANVTAVMNTGVSAWVTAQLAAPFPDNDTSIVQIAGAANQNVEALPVLTGNSTTDGNFGANIEDRLMQWQVNTQWQLREKLTLHWLEHFAVSYATVNQAGDMEHYIQTVRADALGNFAKLVADVSKEPAMMIWLDNANNAYVNANTPPNENFGRELMQLYTIGLTALNPDGSTVPDPANAGQALATYQESDVKNMAVALTGFQLQSQQQIGTYPAYVDKILFRTTAHPPASVLVGGGFSLMGGTVPDGLSCPWTYTTYQQTSLSTGCVVDNAALFLANQRTTWAFQATELLQRLVNEQPSAAMIARISAVWGANVNDPNQIGKVVAAIAADPEFYSGKYTMIKEPIEFEVGAIRALGGAKSNAVTATMATPLRNAINDTRNMNQELWDPPSVFSFYYPGQKSALVNNSEALAIWGAASTLAGAARTTVCTNCSTFLDFTSFASAKTTGDLAGYLLDALVDGGTPQLNALVRNFLNNNPANVQGALWIILSSPEYMVN